MAKKNEPNKVELSQEEYNQLQKEIESSNLSKHSQDLIMKSLQGMIWLSKMLEAKKLSMRKLARLFGFKSEKRSKDDDKKGPPGS